MRRRPFCPFLLAALAIVSIFGTGRSDYDYVSPKVIVVLDFDEMFGSKNETRSKRNATAATNDALLPSATQISTINEIVTIPKVSSTIPTSSVPTIVTQKTFRGTEKSVARTSGKRLTVNVCCGKNEVLDKNYGCVKKKDGQSDEKELMKFLSSLMVGEKLEELKNKPELVLKYGKKIKCSKNDVVAVNWLIGSPDLQPPYLISGKSGHFLELNENRTVSNKYNLASYCFNQQEPKSFVGLICPCAEKVCIQKCCRDGYYFDTTVNECKPRSDAKRYKPKFFNKTKAITKIVPYFLKFRSPQCYKPDDLIIKEDGNHVPHIYVQSSGFLWVDPIEDDNIYIYDNSKYCIDLFSDGPNGKTRVNGFYCPDAMSVRFVYNTKTTMQADTLQVTTLNSTAEAEANELKKKKKKKKLRSSFATELSSAKIVIVLSIFLCFLLKQIM